MLNKLINAYFSTHMRIVVVVIVGLDVMVASGIYAFLGMNDLTGGQRFMYAMSGVVVMNLFICAFNVVVGDWWAHHSN